MKMFKLAGKCDEAVLLCYAPAESAGTFCTAACACQPSELHALPTPHMYPIGLLAQSCTSAACSKTLGIGWECN